MEAHVGSNGPGAMGKSSFISGKDRESPNGTLFSACGGGTSGKGATLVSTAKPFVTATNARAVINGILFLTEFITPTVNSN
jgi:hypothetical protein